MSNRLMQWVKGFYNSGWKILDTPTGTKVVIDDVEINLATGAGVITPLKLYTSSQQFDQLQLGYPLPSIVIPEAYAATSVKMLLTRAAPVDTPLEVDVLYSTSAEGAESIFGANKLTIDAGEYTSETATTAVDFTGYDFAALSRLTILPLSGNPKGTGIFILIIFGGSLVDG